MEQHGRKDRVPQGLAVLRRTALNLAYLKLSQDMTGMLKCAAWGSRYLEKLIKNAVLRNAIAMLCNDCRVDAMPHAG